MATSPIIPIGGANGLQLNTDIDMIERMEKDLRLKATNVFAAYSLTDNIHGVFSLDDLEAKSESDLCQKLGVGVGYLRCEPTERTTDPKDHLNVGRGVAVKQLDFIFSVILAVPTGNECDERFLATKVLTALRFAIMGSTVAGDVVTRTWAFVREFPEIAQSTDTMLYYSQVWRVAMPNVGNR